MSDGRHAAMANPFEVPVLARTEEIDPGIAHLGGIELQTVDNLASFYDWSLVKNVGPRTLPGVVSRDYEGPRPVEGHFNDLTVVARGDSDYSARVAQSLARRALSSDRLRTGVRELLPEIDISVPVATCEPFLPNDTFREPPEKNHVDKPRRAGGLRSAVFTLSATVASLSIIQGYAPEKAEAATAKPSCSGYGDLTKDQIISVQGAVNAKSDGVWGPDTCKRFRAWQELNGLAVDGNLGNISRKVLGLSSASSSGTSSSKGGGSKSGSSGGGSTKPVLLFNNEPHGNGYSVGPEGVTVTSSNGGLIICGKNWGSDTCSPDPTNIDGPNHEIVSAGAWTDETLNGKDGCAKPGVEACVIVPKGGGSNSGKSSSSGSTSRPETNDSSAKPCTVFVNNRCQGGGSSSGGISIEEKVGKFCNEDALRFTGCVVVAGWSAWELAGALEAMLPWFK